MRWHDQQEQVRLLDASVHDDRPSVPTGFSGVDLLLRRGGLLPGTLALLGGRTGTRKSTIVENMMVRMAQANIPVGLVGLDEQPWQYVVSLMSVMSGKSRDWVEQVWDEPEGKALQREYREKYRGVLHLFTGSKPNVVMLSSLAKSAELGDHKAPAVLFIDYLNKLSRDGVYGYGENSRIPRLVEDLKAWAAESGIIVVALHQLSRNDEFGSTNSRNAGHLPVTLAQLKYGGEEDSDIVFGTYRPAMDPIGTMSMEMAKLTLGDRFDEEDYWQASSRVKKHQESTFLQLLKNRPGTHREERGVELLSPYADSLRMEEREADAGPGRPESVSMGEGGRVERGSGRQQPSNGGDFQGIASGGAADYPEDGGEGAGSNRHRGHDWGND
jgi:hypothetical protein